MRAVLFILFLTHIAFGQDLRMEQVDLEKLRSSLPEKWFIAEVDPVDSPAGWRKSEGSKGVKIELSREPYTSELKPTKSGSWQVYRPSFSVCLMPKDFVGEAANGVSFRNGKVVYPESIPQLGQVIQEYSGEADGMFLFHWGAEAFPDWRNPQDTLKSMKYAPADRQRARDALWEAFRKVCPAELRDIDVYAEHPDLKGIVFRSGDTIAVYSLERNEVQRVDHAKMMPGKGINCITYERGRGFALWRYGKLELSIGERL